MPTFADTNLRTLKYVPELLYGVTPGTPAMKTVRSTGDTFAFNKNQIISKEIRQDRAVPSIIDAGVTVEGMINAELSCGGTYDDFFEALLGGTWAANVVKNGVVKRSFTFEKDFTDIATSFIRYLGMRCVEATLNFRAQAVIDGSFTFWGQQSSVNTTVITGETAAGGSPTTSPVVSASADVGAVLKDGAPLTSGLKDLAVTISNSPRHRPIIGSQFDADIGLGQFTIKLTGTALVDDLTFFSDVIAHNTVALVVPVLDENGKGLTFNFPTLKVSGNPDTSAGNQDVDFKFTADAFFDTVSTSMMSITRIP